jgi:hypothetical protein
MKDEFYIGAYWHGRQLTLRQYADAIHAFIKLLRRMHPVFQVMEWVGDRPNAAIKLTSDLSNLDELIYCHAGDGSVHENANADGTPSWSSVCKSSFIMYFATGSKKEGRILISITAGSLNSRTPDSAVMTLPPPDHPLFLHREFFQYDFLKKLFLQYMDFWKPEEGLLTDHAFSNAVSPTDVSYIGWLTYMRDPRAAALRKSASLKGVTFEEALDGGTLISLGGAMISPANNEQVEKAQRLRSILIDEKIIRET